MRAILLTLMLLCAGPVLAKPPPVVQGGGPAFFIAREYGVDSGPVLLPLFEFREGRWRTLSTEQATGARGPSAWYGLLKGPPESWAGSQETLRTDTVAKPVTFQQVDEYEMDLRGVALAGFQVLEPPEGGRWSLYISMNDERLRGLAQAEGPLREAVERVVRATFAPLPELGGQLAAARDSTCKGKGGWVEELSPDKQAPGLDLDQFSHCARGTAEFPHVCQVRMTRWLTEKKSGCGGRVWVEAWVIGTPERLKVVHVDRGASVAPELDFGRRAMAMLVLGDRLFALTQPLCHGSGCNGRVSLVEVDARGLWPVDLSRTGGGR